MTPTGPAEETAFAVNESTLHEPRALNWSVGVERKLPWSIYAGANFLEKRTSDVFTFANQSGAAALAGDYLLTNGREDRYSSEEFDARRLFANGYTVYVSYTHSSARTNAALDYLPTPSPLGPQQSGPLAWDVPNRIISWGWLPVPFARLRKHWDFVYLIDEHTGFPYTAVNAAQQVVGAAGGQRFPDVCELQPRAGVEVPFSRSILGVARRDGECDGQRESGGGEQRGGLAGVWNLQRVARAGVHSANPADRGEVKKTGTRE